MSRNIILCPMGTCPRCDEERRVEHEARCPTRPAPLFPRMWRNYVAMWRDAFGADDPFARFFVRAEIICLHAAVGFALLMLMAWGAHFWRLYVL